MNRLALSAIILLIFLTGCGTKSTVVLLPNPDGTIGEVKVSSETGTQLLTEPNQATEIKSLKSKPSVPKILADEDIENTFSEVIAIQPVPPETFILYFKFDSSALTPQSESLLPKIIETIMAREHMQIEIIVSGHSDRVGDKAYNILLSLKRAESVKDRLVSLGVKGLVIDVTSHGEGNPLIKTADNVSEPRNRRVEVTVK